MRTESLVAILFALALVTGCGEEPQVASYETILPAGVSTVEADGPVDVGGLLVDAPEGWRTYGGSSMLLAKYRSADGAELTISQASGDLLSNINRWRRQLGLQPVPREVDPMLVIGDVFESPAGAVAVIDIVDAEDDPLANRFRVGVLGEVRNGQATGRQWFFKMSGPSEVIDAHQEMFDAMLKSLRPAGEEVQSDG